MVLQISLTTLEPLLSSEVMMLKRCHQPQTERTHLYFSISFSSDYFLQGGETKEHADNVDTTQLRRMRLERQLVELVQIAR